MIRRHFAFALAALLAAVFLGCKPSGTSSLPSGTAPTSGTPTTAYTLRVAGADRSYLVHRPANLPAGPRPLVMLLHGATDSAAYAFEAYHFVDKSDAEGFILVAPDAMGDRRAWQAYDPNPNDDLTFLTTLLDNLERSYSIDKNRIYFAGHSAGAAMTYRFAAEHGDRVAAIGVVAGTVGTVDSGLTRADIPAPKYNIPLIAFHGNADPSLAIDSGRDAAAFWARAIGAGRLSSPKAIPGNEATIQTAHNTATAAHVEFYEVIDGNHMWPGGKVMPGKTQDPVPAPDATGLIWDFFRTHPKLPSP